MTTSNALAVAATNKSSLDAAQSVTLEQFVFLKGSTPVTTSLKVAEAFGKQHKHVLRDIQNLDCSEEYLQSNFGPQIRTVEMGKGAVREYPYFELTKDGFMFLVMGYTGAQAAKIKESYIKAFNMMTDKLFGGDPLSPKAPESTFTGAKRFSTQDLEDYERSITVFERTLSVAYLFGLSGNQALLSADKGCYSLTGISMIGTMGIKGLLANPKGYTYTPTQLGELVGDLGPQEVNIRLMHAGLQEKINGLWVPTEKASGMYEMLDVGKRYSNGTPVKQIKWFEEVVPVIKATVPL